MENLFKFGEKIGIAVKTKFNSMKKSTLLQILGVSLFITHCIVNYFFPLPDGIILADVLVTALTTGAGVNTVVPSVSQLESDILIGDVDTAMPLRGLKVTVDGKTTIDVQGSQPLMSVLSKFGERTVATVVGLVMRVATGRIKKNCSITFTNDGVTTPSVLSNSNRSNGFPIEAETVGINALSNQSFSNFAGLFITPAANLGSCDVIFADGTDQRMLAVEMDALFTRTHDTQADGRLDAVVSGFDNRQKTIASVKVNATTAVTVMIIK